MAHLQDISFAVLKQSIGAGRLEVAQHLVPFGSKVSPRPKVGAEVFLFFHYITQVDPSLFAFLRFLKFEVGD